MYQINISFHAERAVYDEALTLVRRYFLPSCLASRLLFDPLLCTLLIEVDPQVASFSLAFRTESADDAMAYFEKGEGAALFSTLHEAFGHRLLHFITPMEILE